MPQSKITVLRNGKPAMNIKVTLEFVGIVNMGFTKAIFTDKNGIALISHSSNGKALVYLDGRRWGELFAPNQDTFYL